MRAGLLSKPDVINLINDRFVSTWVLVDELNQAAHTEDAFAETLKDNWEYPLDLMFLTADGKYVKKLNSFRDFPAHSEVGHPGHPFSPYGPTHSDVFLMHAKGFLRSH
jgi:hypothetical protein